MRSQFTDFIRETEIYDPDHLQLTPDYIQVTQQVTLSDGGYACYYLMATQTVEAPRAACECPSQKLTRTTNTNRANTWIHMTCATTKAKTCSASLFGCRLVHFKHFGNSRTPEFLDYLNSNPRLRQRYQQSDCEEVAYNLFARFGFSDGTLPPRPASGWWP